jgi:hypothetical protein
MKKVSVFIAVIIAMFTACKQKESLVVEDYPIVDPCPETSVDYELRDVEGGKNYILTNQPIPNGPDAVVQPNDTIQLCKAYGDSTWHVEEIHNIYGAEVDHCEFLKNSIIVSFKKITYHYTE